MKSLKELWVETLEIGYTVRKLNLDGREHWQALKEKYTKLSGGLPIQESFSNLCTGYVIKSDKREHTDAIFKCKTVILSNLIDTHHFFIQHIRIPIIEEFEVPIFKLLHIAYNAGLYKAENEKGLYPNEISDYYFNNKLDKIETYIDAEYGELIPK